MFYSIFFADNVYQSRRHSFEHNNQLIDKSEGTLMENIGKFAKKYFNSFFLPFFLVWILVGIQKVLIQHQIAISFPIEFVGICIGVPLLSMNLDRYFEKAGRIKALGLIFLAFYLPLALFDLLSVDSIVISKTVYFAVLIISVVSLLVMYKQKNERKRTS